MSHHEIAFGTVIYPASFQFIDEFISSVNQQTCNAFDLLVINDGVQKKLVEEKFNLLSKSYRLVDNDFNYNPAQLRTLLIQKAKLYGYSLLILGDSDDSFSRNRVEKVYHFYDQNSKIGFFYNRLLFWDKSLVMPPLPKNTRSIASIADYNYLGLSNTSINLNCIDDDFIESLFEFKDIIYDWYLYSRLLLNKLSGIYVPEVETYYRSWGSNIIGQQRKSPELIQKEVDVKRLHYGILSKYSTILEKRYQSYVKGEYVNTKVSDLYYWWNYTVAIGG